MVLIPHRMESIPLYEVFISGSTSYKKDTTITTKNNGREWGVIFPTQSIVMTGFVGNQISCISEIIACINALQYTLDYLRSHPLKIFTTSTYLINVIEGRWIVLHKEPHIQLLYKLLEQVPVTWKYIRPYYTANTHETYWSTIANDLTYSNDF